MALSQTTDFNITMDVEPCRVEENTSCSDECNDKSDVTDPKVEYNLRRSSLVNRVLSERKRSEPKQPKPKAKPPPLSKYRRRAANHRERSRMTEINVAFDTLQSVIPIIEQGPSLKMTKITTLRLALNYICALREMLGFEDDFNSDASSLRSSTGSSGDESCASPVDIGNTISETFPGQQNCYDIAL